VLDAQNLRDGAPAAFKVLRPEHLDAGGTIRWEYRAFAHEADLLARLVASPQVVDLLDCGFIEAPGEAPFGGTAESYGLDVAAYASAFEEHAGRGWRPYLALENLPRTQNLFYLMKTNKPGVRWRLPSEEGLALALQFANMLKLAHSQGIVYLDHKLEHVYWDGVHLRIIDFNSSRQLEGDLRAADNINFFRLDIHNLCVGILYPVFTGLSPQKTTLRPQPGTRADVESRYSDITSLDFGVEPTLSAGIKDVLQRGAAMAFQRTEQFLDALYEAAARLGWDSPDHYTSPASREARAQLRAGLAQLRAGQDSMRAARDHFREAAIMEGITPDLEDELRRLVKAVNDMLNHRVIP
jgi:serine/threonine protein kinase